MYASLVHVRKLRSFVYYTEIRPVEVIIQGAVISLLHWDVCRRHISFISMSVCC